MLRVSLIRPRHSRSSTTTHVASTTKQNPRLAQVPPHRPMSAPNRGTLIPHCHIISHFSNYLYRSSVKVVRFGVLLAALYSLGLSSGLTTIQPRRTSLMSLSVSCASVSRVLSSYTIVARPFYLVPHLLSHQMIPTHHIPCDRSPRCPT